MEHDFWHARWHKAQIGWHLPAPNPLLQRYWPQLNLHTGATVGVPLCGKSVDMVWLLEQGYRVVGIELSPLAREQFMAEQGIALQPQGDGWWASEGERLRWFEGDFFQLTPEQLGPVDAVYDRAALVAFSAARRRDYVHQLARLVPGARLLLISLTAEGVPLDAGPPFVVPDDEVQQLFAPVAMVQQVGTHGTQRKGQPWWEHVWTGAFKTAEATDPPS